MTTTAPESDDDTPAPDTATEPAEEHTGDPGPGSDDVDATDDEHGNREAAKYRRKLRDAEAERDRLAGVVESYQRAQVEAIATGPGPLALNDGADLWAAGVTLGDLLAEDGTVDADAVAAAVERVTDERPHWRKPAVDLGQGVRGSVRTKQAATWDGTVRDFILNGGG